MTRKIISIGYEIPGYSDDCFDYTSDQSLLDADVVVFEPEKYSSSSGKASFNEEYSGLIQQSASHWRKELTTALQYGKTVFLLFRKYQVAQIYTGQKEFKGARTINYVQDFNNYQFLPIDLPAIIPKTGSEVIFKNHPVFSNFWKAFKDGIKYESYLNDKIGAPIFVTRTGEKIIGTVIKAGKGNLVIIPPVDYNRESFLKKGKKANEYLWNAKALQFGEKLISAFLEIDKSLRTSGDKTPPPSWVANEKYQLAGEEKISSEIGTIRAQIDKFSGALEKLLVEKEISSWPKDLLFETGKRLENSVIQALKIIGYSAENLTEGDLEIDQIIISPEGDRFIGECEGKDSSAISIDKFRQLEENIQTDLQREQVESPAIGILFGNGFRLTNPEERAEQFTAKCLSSAKRGTILVCTSDLFPVVTYLMQSKDDKFAKLCRQTILNSRGGITKFPQIPKIDTVPAEVTI